MAPCLLAWHADLTPDKTPPRGVGSREATAGAVGSACACAFVFHKFYLRPQTTARPAPKVIKVAPVADTCLADLAHPLSSYVLSNKVVSMKCRLVMAMIPTGVCRSAGPAWPSGFCDQRDEVPYSIA